MTNEYLWLLDEDVVRIRLIEILGALTEEKIRTYLKGRGWTLKMGEDHATTMIRGRLRSVSIPKDDFDDKWSRTREFMDVISRLESRPQSQIAREILTVS